MKRSYPNRHDNSILEAISEKYFRNCLPIEWLIEKPIDYGIDFNITPVLNGDVLGLNFSMQLKAKKDIKEKLEVRLKKTTLNYLFNRLEPVMVVLYDEKSNQAYWKWLIWDDFDLSKDVQTYIIQFNKDQKLSIIQWEKVCGFIQKIFKVKNKLITSLEYDLFNTHSELETKAWSHYLNRNLTEAAFYFKRLVKEESKAIWLLVLAQCQYQQFDYSSAILNINKALELEEDDNILLTKGCILAEDGIRNNDYRKLREAEKIFGALYEKQPTATHAYNYANTIYKLNELNKAEQLYKYALKLNPNYAEAWKNLGQIYYDFRKHKLELKCYERALAINPNLSEAKISKAITLGFIYREYKASINTILEEIVKDETTFTRFQTIYYWLGYFYFQLNKIKEALEWINKGLNNNPGDSLLLNLKANLFINTIDLETELLSQAILFFQDNYKLNENDAVNFYYLCCCLSKNNNENLANNMAKAWLCKKAFLGILNDTPDFELSFDKALLLIKNWYLIQAYIVQYSIEKIELELDYAKIDNSKSYLQSFHLARMQFITGFIELLNKNPKQKSFKSQTSALYKYTFLNIDNNSVSVLITNPKSDLEKFANQFSIVTVTLGHLCLIEASRCAGFVIGSRKIGTEKKLLNDIVDPSLLTDTILYYAEILYRHFDLPMK